MLKKMPCLLLLNALFLIYAFVADDAGLTALTQKLEKFRKSYPQEKVHLHLDKPWYSVGDTVYFKAYVVNAEKNTASAISNILYVDVIDENDTIQLTVRRPVAEGVAWGTINLTDPLPQGNYRIRAYTNWMRNFSNAYFYEQEVAVGDVLNNDIVTNTAVTIDAATGKGNATVLYQSIHSYSVAGKEVNYSVVANNKEIQKGKGKTDNEGNIVIELRDELLTLNRHAQLITHMKVDNKTTVTKLIKLEASVTKHNIQFFPEGGQMVSGLPVRIGFKAQSSGGSGAEVSGRVIDETSGDTVSFRSGFAGIGSFQFTPQAGHSYHAFVKYKSGLEEKVTLPNQEASGYVLAAENSDPEQVKLIVAARQTPMPDNITIVAQSNNRIQYTATLALQNGLATALISKKKFPTGIVQITLFDAALQPVAERLIFINHQDHLNINMTFDKTAYVKRENTKMTLMVQDAKGNPVTGNFSVAVTDGNTVEADKMKQRSIFSNLLLTSDIRGYIENPEYYFTDVNSVKIKELDDLLLTQGWRRFIWKDILANKYPDVRFKAEKSLAISGRVLSLKGEPLAAAKVTLISKKGTGFILDILTAADGSFLFDELDFDDDKPFVVQAVKAGGSSDVQIKLDNYSAPLANTDKNAIATTSVSDNVMISYLTQTAKRFDEMKKNGLIKDKAHVLKEVVVTAKQLTKVQEAVAPSSNLNGPGRADKIITYEDLRNCNDLAQCIPSKLIGIRLKTYVDPVTRRIYTRAYSYRSMDNSPMLIIMDGMDMDLSGSFSLNSLPASDIQSVELLTSGVYLSSYGTRGAGGVLVITTKRGGIDYNGDDKNSKSKTAESNILFTTAKGYTASRKFYSPDYSAGEVSNAMPDLRSTIYWQPNVTTDENGKATISFYNADNAATYNVIIEGLSDDGKPGRAFFKYEVK